MSRSTRGAARVSVVWMISVLVLFFAALAFAFVATSDLAAAESAEEKALAEAEEAVERFQNEADTDRAISEAVGWFPEESANPRTNLEAMASTMESFKDAFGITESVDTLQDLLPLSIDAHERCEQELAQKSTRITTLEGELSQARKTIDDVTRNKDQQLADLRQQLADREQQFTRAEQDISKRLASAQARITELSDEASELRSRMEAEAKQAERELSRMVARADTLAGDLRLQKQPDLPDGQVLVTSDELSLAWIDVGANDRLARGTRFRILSPGPDPVFKGWAQVTELRPSMAEVTLSEVDPFQPVVPGDVIVNPVYAPGGERHAVLAGRFSSPSERELVALLDRMGITVQDSIDVETDYLITGSPVYTTEDGEILDEPIRVEELPTYREAEGRGGIEIVPVSDLRGYFVF